MPKKTTLIDQQKHELCVYACDNKKTQSQYVEWIENKWNLKYQTILTDALLVEKAKVLADSLGIPQNALSFSPSWLYKLEPDYILATQHLSGCKRSKERLSIALCANVNGSHKLNSFIIGKYKKLRCFKNINVIFKLDITRSRKWMMRRRFKNGCVKAIHFTIQGSLEDFHQTTDSIINEIANALESLGLPDPINVEKYIAIPEENIVYEVLPNNQVIMELVETFRMDNPIDADSEDADNSLEIPIVSADMATASLKTMLTFLLQQDNTEKYINYVKKIKNFIKKIKVGHMRQSKID
ncbi:7963_t:CDS:2 [Dentiscutata erythropus]|uniref:7963_t:CDS:1 n=1 Tax=Dentiscutata erythropus TaxID=1348616 RepID=A0A9N9CK13_9GLOM|nr:7963_t:CDS:2 [Dentiscutata erythropus]